MKAMILAAGRGERLRPLTDDTPKPLIEVGGKPLIAWHLEALQRAGVEDIVINLSYLGDRIESALGDGRQLNVSIRYSHEPPGALDTGGGILNALPLLGDAPFYLVNGDVWTDLDFTTLNCSRNALGHLVLVDRAGAHPGDFALRNGLATNDENNRLTYSGCAILKPELFDGCDQAGFPLAPLLRHAADQGRLGAEHYRGAWFDAGTPQRLATLRDFLRTA